MRRLWLRQGGKALMNRKNVEIAPLPAHAGEQAPSMLKKAPLRGVVLCRLAFILCSLISVTPLLHLAGKTFLWPLPTNPFLRWWVSWLPANVQLASAYRASMITTNSIEFLLLMALAFGVYGLSAFFIQRLPEQSDYKNVLRLIWLGTIIGGLIFVLTPAMLSRDIFVYVGYGRTIVVHHANPYFVAPSRFPQDPLTSYDDWKDVTAAYGPVWLTICSLWTLVLGNSPLGYVLAFRLFALAAHLLNIWLVATILRKMGSSARTVTLGTLLYAWNPLVLQESSLGGHNDIFMVTLILLGILLCLHAEQQHFARPSHYLPPVLALMLAALVKFTALPLIALFLVVLARNTLYTAQSASPTNEQNISRHWKPMLLKVLLACIAAGFVALTFYAPFWIGHSIPDIVHSFSSPPSARFSEYSLLRTIYQWIKVHGLPAHTSWTYTPLYVLSQRNVWDRINYVTLGCLLIIATIWIWRIPTTRTMILAALATLGALLIVTPWFFAWYVTWLVGLAIVCLPVSNDRIGRALVAFTLTFSATALITYLYHDYPPIGSWNFPGWLAMIGLPLIVLSVFVISKNTSRFD